MQLCNTLFLIYFKEPNNKPLVLINSSNILSCNLSHLCTILLMLIVNLLRHATWSDNSKMQLLFCYSNMLLLFLFDIPLFSNLL